MDFILLKPISYLIKIEQAMRKIGDDEGIPILKGITEVGLREETNK